jgi:cytochrome c oxidase subunit IV
MSEEHAHEAQHDAHEHHIVSPKVYVIVAASLLTLTGTTVWASYQEWGVFNPVAALGIAVVKASLVVLFFMGAKYSTKLTKLTIISGIFIFLGLIGMTLADYMSRAWGQW